MNFSLCFLFWGLYLLLSVRYWFSSFQLEVVVSNRGILISGINLTGSIDAVTIVNGLLVFKAASISDIKPGVY